MFREGGFVSSADQRIPHCLEQFLAQTQHSYAFVERTKERMSEQINESHPPKPTSAAVCLGTQDALSLTPMHVRGSLTQTRLSVNDMVGGGHFLDPMILPAIPQNPMGDPFSNHWPPIPIPKNTSWAGS